ncbi:glycosyltransferase family 2 protein [Lutibacter sp.]|uniref:glycosyltransferase family 2 protein n=1 Tax=Lutibacter sp. TaxID=1925666 RepID=UPI0025BB31B8|nr:glycosyltransferase family 2 protein [Lutibacter sp.]MCF6182885.1 glycosyltransferase [Lutibacter sp.]
MLLSIITINYNNAIGLKKTMQSVVNQTWSNFEYIVIDGNSSDNSVAIIKAFNFTNLKWISEQDTGIYNAMNKGIKMAKSEYLLFLNSGDVLNGVTALNDFIQHPNLIGDIIYGDYKFDKGEKIYPDVLTPLFFIKSSLPHQSTFFKRSVFDSIGLYDESYKIAADRAFYIKCFLSDKFKFTHIKYPLTIYDLTGLSNSKDFNFTKKKEDEAIFKKYYGLFYNDYMKYLQLEKELSIIKGLTFKGMIKRIKKRLKI